MHVTTAGLGNLGSIAVLGKWSPASRHDHCIPRANALNVPAPARSHNRTAPVAPAGGDITVRAGRCWAVRGVRRLGCP